MYMEGTLMTMNIPPIKEEESYSHYTWGEGTLHLQPNAYGRCNEASYVYDLGGQGISHLLPNAYNRCKVPQAPPCKW